MDVTRSGVSKIVLVTGAYRGIGKILVDYLAPAWNVWPVYRTAWQAAQLHNLTQETSCISHWFHGDLRNTGTIRTIKRACTRQEGSIHALIHCPGPIIYSPQVISRWSTWESMFRDNMQSSVNLIRELGGSIHSGRIILFGFSGLDTRAGYKTIAAYAAAKEALASLARSAAKMLASQQTTLNVIAPGVFLDDNGEVPSHGARMLPAIPLGRYGGPGDITGVVEWLISEQSQYVTGQVIKGSGGLHIS